MKVVINIGNSKMQIVTALGDVYGSDKYEHWWVHVYMYILFSDRHVLGVERNVLLAQIWPDTVTCKAHASKVR